MGLDTHFKEDPLPFEIACHLNTTFLLRYRKELTLWLFFFFLFSFFFPGVAYQEAMCCLCSEEPITKFVSGAEPQPVCGWCGVCFGGAGPFPKAGRDTRGFNQG